jgi:hypothetical protein
MLGHGSNSRIKYGIYKAYDKRMWRETASRLLINSNRPITSRSVTVTQGLELVSYTHESTYNTGATEWELKFSWTVNNPNISDVDYQIYLDFVEGPSHQIGVYTADASSVTGEASVPLTITGGQIGDVTVYMRLVDDTTSKVLATSETFTITLIDATVTSGDVDFDMPVYLQTDVIVSNLVGNATINYTITYRNEKFDGSATVTSNHVGATDLLANLVGTAANLWPNLNNLYHRRRVQFDLTYEGYTYTSAWSSAFCYPPDTTITTFAMSLKDADIKFNGFDITVDAVGYTGMDIAWWISVDARVPYEKPQTTPLEGNPQHLNFWVPRKTIVPFNAGAPYSSGQEITSARRFMYPQFWMVGHVPFTAKAGFDVDNWTPSTGGLGPIYYPTVADTHFTLAPMADPWAGYRVFFQSVTGTWLPGTFEFSITVSAQIAGHWSDMPAESVIMDPQSLPGTLALERPLVNFPPTRFLIDSVQTKLNDDVYHTNDFVFSMSIYLPPAFTSWSMSATDVTQDGYNIKLDTFVGFTQFVGIMTDSYEIQLVIKDGVGIIHTETVTWRPATDTLPFTLFSPNRATHSSWFNGAAQTHAIDANLFYNFNWDFGPGLIASKTQTDIVTGVYVPPDVVTTYDLYDQSDESYQIRLTSLLAPATYDLIEIKVTIRQQGGATLTTVTYQYDTTIIPAYPLPIALVWARNTDAWWDATQSTQRHEIDIEIAYDSGSGRIVLETKSTELTTNNLNRSCYQDQNTGWDPAYVIDSANSPYPFDTSTTAAVDWPAMSLTGNEKVKIVFAWHRNPGASPSPVFTGYGQNQWSHATWSGFRVSQENNVPYIFAYDTTGTSVVNFAQMEGGSPTALVQYRWEYTWFNGTVTLVQFEDGVQRGPQRDRTSSKPVSYQNTSDRRLYMQSGLSNGNTIEEFGLFDTRAAPVKLDLSSFTVLSQVSYDTTNGAWDWSKVYNDNYGYSASDNAEWVVGSAGEFHLWVWLDLGSSHTLEYIQLWQNKLTLANNRINNIQMHITDTSPGANPAKYVGSDWMYDFQWDANTRWYWVGNDSRYIAGTLDDKPKVGGVSDPSLPYTSDRTTGYYEFHFDHTSPANRKGRYLYMQFQRTPIYPGVARLYEIDLYGNSGY